MSYGISAICFTEDDPDGHDAFSTALNQVFSTIILALFYSCDSLIEYSGDQHNPLREIFFLDYWMPGDDECECLIKLKETARTFHIPVIINSTASYPGFIEVTCQSGADRYIIKPASFDDIKAMMKLFIREYGNANEEM